MTYATPNTDLATRIQTLINILLEHRPDIERVLRLHHYSHDFDYIVTRVLSGELDVYTPKNSLILCELIRYPNHKTYSVYLATGCLTDLTSHLPVLETYATQLGADYLALTGRPGWCRVLREDGWQHDLSIMHKRL